MAGVTRNPDLDDPENLSGEMRTSCQTHGSMTPFALPPVSGLSFEVDDETSQLRRLAFGGKSLYSTSRNIHGNKKVVPGPAGDSLGPMYCGSNLVGQACRV